MDLISQAIDFVLHIDKYMDMIIQAYGFWSYFLLFFIIFIETGLVVTPFLPGDSLIFAAGTFAAIGSFNVSLLFILLTLAAILGNTVNYFIGRKIGMQIYQKKNVRFIKKRYLDETQAFYHKHGGKTIIITRFIPIIRTFAPFVAGIGNMNFAKFAFYNIIGGVSWVGLFTLLGYYFGNLPSVKSNFTFVIFAIIIISVMPGVIGVVKQRIK
ncbi:MAG: DedA family protein [Peptococcaceae bacterium]|nr:DedA family protein [Peptococcaceae bacterium]